MFGFSLARPANACFDNNGVVNNTRIPESNLYKKHNEISYHCLCEADSDRIIRVGKEYSATNLDDPLT